MIITVSNEEGTVTSCDIPLPSDEHELEIVKHRLVKLASTIGGSVTFSNEEEDSILLNIPDEWLKHFESHLDVLLINLLDIKAIEVLDDGSELLRTNSDELVKRTNFTDIVNSRGDEVAYEYVKKNGFCLLAYQADDLRPTIFTLDKDHDLFRVYIFEEDCSSYIGLKEVRDLSVTAVQTDFFNCKELVTLLETVTNRNYYPKDKLNGYLTVLEMFY